MNSSKISFQNILILSAVGISFIFAQPDPELWKKCDAAMTAAFEVENALPLDCVKKSIRSFILGQDLIHLHNDLEDYYRSFASKIDFTSIVTPPDYCADIAKGKNEKEHICNVALKHFGEPSSNKAQYQINLVTGILYDNKQIKAAEFDEYYNNQIFKICVEGSYGYDYLEYTAQNIRLIEEDPSVSWVAYHALQNFGGADDPKHHQMYSTFMRSPRHFCDFKYGPESI